MATQMVPLDGWHDVRNVNRHRDPRSSADPAPILLGLTGRSVAGRAAAAIALSLAEEWASSLEVLLELERESAIRQLLDCVRTGDTSLIVLGLRAVEGAASFANETVLRVMRRASVPVLAVPALGERPRRAVAAIDFSAPSMKAARMALRVLQPGGTLLLAHVQPDFTGASDESDIALSYRRGIHGAFVSLVKELAASHRVRLEPYVLEGAPLPALRTLVERAGATLVALGTSRGDHLSPRQLSPMIATLVREGRLSLISAPPRTHGEPR